MRLKDKDLKDKITQLTDKFTSELEGEKMRYETLAAEKNDMEMEYEDRIKNMDERHAAGAGKRREGEGWEVGRGKGTGRRLVGG